MKKINEEMNEEDQCIFHACDSSTGISFKDIIKEDYSFLNLSSYDDDKLVNI